MPARDGAVRCGERVFIHHQRRLRHEEPFALTAKCAVLARVAFAGRDVIARERVTNVLRLERIHRLTHARSAARHGSDEPFTFVMAAEEAVESAACRRLCAPAAADDAASARSAARRHPANRCRCVGTRSSKNSPLPSRWMSTAKSAGSIHVTISLTPARRDLTHFQARAHLRRTWIQCGFAFIMF